MPPSTPASHAQGLGATFKTLRKQAGIRQDILAAAIGVSKSHLSHFENGRRELARDTYDRLIHALAAEGTRQRRAA